MTSLVALWLPILLSAVVVFIASSIIHMVLPWHRSDYPKLPNEDKVADALRGFSLTPGDYMLPRAATAKDMSTPEFQEKMKRGPVVILSVLPNGPVSMAPRLLQWFVYCVVVSVFAGYVAGRALGPDASYLRVFQLVGAAAFASYVLALWQMTIWYGRGVSLTVKSTFDGLIYSLLTAGVFGWLWPH